MPPCACQYETASLQVAEGELRGVLVCAVCERPKLRPLPDRLADFRELSQRLNIPEHTLRTLRTARRITALVERGSTVLFHVPSVLRQLGVK